MNSMKKASPAFTLFICILLLFHLNSARAADKTASPEPLPYDTLLGDWKRTDGNYLIRASNIQPDGGLEAEYFNPRPINVEHAAITTEKNLLKLFIQLRDKGYEGSTYTLYYYAKEDALAGFYYQAPSGKTYEVVFRRNSL